MTYEKIIKGMAKMMKNLEIHADKKAEEILHYEECVRAAALEESRANLTLRKLTDIFG